MNVHETDQRDDRAQFPELQLALRLIQRGWAWIVLGTAIGVVGSLAWLAGSDPVYRATATLLLDDDKSAGVLGELASLSRAPAATAEIALLSSRSIAESVVLAPADGSLPTPDNLAASRHQGLTTRVDDDARRPLATLLARFVGGTPNGRLYAAAEPLSAVHTGLVEVRFPDLETIRLTAIAEGNVDTDAAGATVEAPFVPGHTYECGGLALRFERQGDTTGRTFQVHYRSQVAALVDLMSATRVVETQRNSGVIAVTVDDSDPERAAALANAICFNYFDLNVERNQRRASQTVEFIEDQLSAQLASLEEAEREVVRLQSDAPESIDVVAAAQSLIEDLSDLEVRRMELSLQRAALGEALSLLADGQYEALSRLSTELADPLSTSLLEQIGLLDMQVRTSGLPRTDGVALMLSSRANDLRQLVDELALQINSLRETLQAIDDGRPGAFAFLAEQPDLGVVIDPLTRGYLSEIARLEAERDAMGQEFKDNYPPLIALDERIDELEGRVRSSLVGRLAGLQSLFEDRTALARRAERDAEDLPIRADEVNASALDDLHQRIESHLANRLDALVDAEHELGAYVTQLEQDLAALPERQRQLFSPLRRLETHKEIAAFLMKSMQEAEITRASTVSSADFIDPASPPRLRSAPRVGMTLGLFGVLGVALGFALAWGRELMRSSISSPTELEELTGMPILAAVPDFTRGRHKVAASGQDFIALRDDPAGTVAEAYRSLRANLRFALGDVSELRSLAATSCAPGEGKSTTNVDIAWAFASGGRRVLLVDADMRKPSVHRYLGLDRGPGLAEVLAGAREWQGIVQTTDNPQLSVLTAGQIRGVAGDALNGEAAQELLDELSAAYDLVVFDLPPALAVADVETFAHRLDALLLLYRAHGVPADAVRTAVSRLRQAGSNLVGAILNAYRPERTQGGEGQYGGYGYYGYGDEAPLEEDGHGHRETA